MGERIRPGIYHHPGLVYPVPANFFSKMDIPVTLEDGFTFAISEEMKEMLHLAFLNANRENIGEEAYQEELRDHNKRYSKVLKNK